MATRPVYLPERSGPQLVRTEVMHFDWFPGLSITQARRSIESLHSSVRLKLGIDRILEISTKSPSELGVSLSAFNLKIRTIRKLREFAVESAYQGSKVFEYGGPYSDLLKCSPSEAKKDPRLSNSGRLVGFRFLRTDWPLQPKTAFYDWLYVNALRKKPGLLKQALDYEAFTDIAFNPKKSVNCQAYAAALCVSLECRGLINDVLATREGFLGVLKKFDHESLEDHVRLPNRQLLLVQEGLDMKESGASLAQFNDMQFRSWNSLKTLASVLTAWRPDSHQGEKDLEDSLYKYLQEELPDVKVTRKYSDGLIRADLAIADSVLLEVKTNLDSYSRYRQLHDQITAWRDWEGELILLLIGKVDPALMIALKKEINASKKSPIIEPKVTIIQK